METANKITVEAPSELPARRHNQPSVGAVTQTVRAGHQLAAASQASAPLRQLRGKVRFAHVSRVEARPMIAAGTSAWIAFKPRC
jgi:hypothetical protein